MNFEIRVDELQAGDVWIGNDNVFVNEVTVPVDYRAASSNGDLVTLPPRANQRAHRLR